MQRLREVDALRALALLGILAANIWYFAEPEFLESGWRSAPRDAPGDQLVSFATTLLIEGKAYVIFSFLFGLSFVWQWTSAQRAGADETARALRRFASLAVLGVAHGLLLFSGDILLAYALLGCLLLSMRRVGLRWAALFGVVLLAGFPLLLLADTYLALGADGFSAGAAGDPEAARAAYSGGLSSYLGFQLEAYAWVMPNVLLGQGPMAFGAFLIGLAVGRAQLIERILRREISTARLITWMVPALVVGLMISWAAAQQLWGPPGSTGEAGASSAEDPRAELVGQTLIFLAGPVQAFGYTIAALLILRSGSSRRLTDRLASAGQMSLSNYLGQSLVLALIFSGLGLGLAGQLSAAAVGAVVLILWAAQVGLSSLWLRRFRRGPMETLVRAVTYGRVIPAGHPKGGG